MRPKEPESIANAAAGGVPDGGVTDAIKRRSQAVWDASPAGTTFGAGFEPGTPDFFTAVLTRRGTYEMPWLKEIVPFVSFRDQDVLEIGCGAGYDAFELCRAGARYTGVDLAPKNPPRVQRHLRYLGYEPHLALADAERLPFRSAAFDVVFSNGVLHHTPDIAASFDEVARVLRTNGEFWLVLYHRDSLYYWITLGLSSWVLRGGFLKRSWSEQLSTVEYTTSSEAPLVRAYSRRQLQKLLAAAGFASRGFWIRKLTREDLPGLFVFRRLKQTIPQETLDRIGTRFGWYIIVRAAKV